MPSSLLSTTTTRDFVGIPPEMQIRILRNLDAVSLVRCAMTCVSLNDLVKNASQLMYIIHLHLDGLKDCGTAAPNADSVARLLQRRHAWLSLVCMERVPAEIPFDYCADAWDLVGGAVAYADEGTLEILQLPTSGDERGRKIGRALGGLTPLCVTVDPTQDLMVFLQNVPGVLLHFGTHCSRVVAEIRICTMSSGAPHPLASKSSLQFDGENIYGYLVDDTMEPVLQIAHNILAVSLGVSDTRTRIWDWTTSDLLLDTAWLPESFPEHMNGSAMILLDATYFLYACAHSNSLRLYKLDRTFSVNDCHTIHLATLHLPALRAEADIRSISILSNAIQARPRPHPTLATTDDPEARLHVLRLMYFRGDEGPSDDGQIGLLFMHQRVLTNYIAEHARLGGPALNIPWTEWGPRNTRLISPAEGLVNSYDKRYVYGQRAAFACSETGVDVFDFSLAAVLSAKGYIPTPAASGASWELSLSTRVGPLYECPFFVDNFNTYLPYVHIKRDVKLKCRSVLMYADGVVCTNELPTNSTSNRTVTHVYAI